MVNLSTQSWKGQSLIASSSTQHCGLPNQRLHSPFHPLPKGAAGAWSRQRDVRRRDTLEINSPHWSTLRTTGNSSRKGNPSTTIVGRRTSKATKEQLSKLPVTKFPRRKLFSLPHKQRTKSTEAIPCERKCLDDRIKWPWHWHTKDYQKAQPSDSRVRTSKLYPAQEWKSQRKTAKFYFKSQAKAV